MSYENPEVPHEVNVSRESPIVEFLRLAAGIGVCVLLLTAVLYFFGGQLARHIPFSTERSWVGEKVIGVKADKPLTQQQAKIEVYLQSLVDELAAKMALPQDMKLAVHYADMEVPNAFATLGGHIIVTSGLYRRLPSENALTMVLGHEIAHVKARDPISAVGGGASVAVLLALVGGDASALLPRVSQLVLLGYSRRAESDADEAAIKAVIAYYGHAGGAASLFEVLADYHDKGGISVPSLLSTHPADADRIARIKSAAATWDSQRQPLRQIAISDDD
jgi:Zn-dependent protease with chaperone function